MEALERWLIRETVRREVRMFLDGKVQFKASATSSCLVDKIFERITEFPAFKQNDDEGSTMQALEQLFRQAPAVEKALRTRSTGTFNLERFFVSLIASPVVSAARQRHAMQALAEEAENVRYGGNAFSELSSKLLQEITSGQSGGVRLLLEELKCAHSLEELRPSLQAFLAGMRESWATKFLRAARRNLSKLKSKWSRLPQQLLLTVLKLHSGDRATAAAIHVMFIQPFGVYSIWQRFLSEAVNLDFVTDEYERIYEMLPDHCRSVLIENSAFLLKQLETLHLAGSADELEFNATAASPNSTLLKAQRDVVVDYLQVHHKIIFDGEPEKWAAFRFVELHEEKLGLESLVELLGADAFTTPLQKVLIACKTKLADSFLSKGSGLVKLVETLLSIVQAGIHEAEKNISDDVALFQKLCKLWEQVQVRGLILIHNMLVNDNTLVVHETIYWLIDLYRAAQEVKLPDLHQMIQSLSSTEQEAVLKEAEMARTREAKNLQRDAAQAKLPMPPLPHSTKLVDQFEKAFLEQLNVFKTRHAEMDRLMYRPQFATSSDCQASMPRTDHHHADSLGHLDLTWHESQAKAMQSRGYLLRGSTRSCKIWARPCLYFDTSQIIADVKLSHMASASDPEWMVIPRNLNKNVFGTSKVYLHYRRVKLNGVETQSSLHSVKDISLLDASISANALPKVRGAEWKSIGVFRHSLMSETQVWVLYG